MKKFISILIISILFSAYANAGILKGYVLDPDGNPLAGAFVHDKSAKTTAVADSDGYFEIELDLQKEKSVVVEFMGFATNVFSFERPGDIQIIVMQPNAQIEETVVTSHGTGQFLRKGDVFNTEVVTSQSLTRAACCNLSESFETNPSVDVAYSNAVTGAKQIQLLGLAGTYVQMLTENFPNLRGGAAVYGLDYIPGPWMQSIQVSKGAASVKNGFESISGEIDVEYKKPKIADPLLINLFASDVGRYEGNAVGAIELNDRLSTALFVNYYSEEQSHDKNEDTFLDMPKMHSFSAMNRWHYQTPSFVSQTGFKILTDARTSGQTAHTLKGKFDYEPYTIDIDVNRIEAFSKNGFILNQDRGESIAVIVSGSYHDQRSDYSSRIYNLYESNVYASLLYESKFGDRHKLAAGLNFNWDNFAQRGNVVEDDCPWLRNAHESVGGAYAEYTWTPVKQLTVMVGLREDYSNLHKWFTTPRIHVKYDPASWLNIRASAGRGYRTTFVLPENSYILASSRKLFISNDLDQEKAWNFGISAAVNIPKGSDEYSFSAEWFYTDFDDQVVMDLDSSPHAVSFYNLDGTSTSSVVQVQATLPLFRGFSLLTAWRWMNVRTTYGTKTLRKPLSSKYKALATASYETPLRKWQFDVTAQFNGGGRMPAPDSANPLWKATFHPFTLLSAQVTRKFKHFSIYVGGENLTGYKQKDPIISAENPYGSDFDATMVWGPTMGRRLYIGVRYNIPKI
jgi:outer membrane receptor for ferrienterochelin and colicin